MAKMTLLSSQIPCLICNTDFIKFTNNNSDKPASIVEANTKVFNSCSKYLNVDIKEIDPSLNWNFNRESLPFCETCFLTTNKLHSLHEQIQSLQQEVEQIVTKLKVSLTESHQQSTLANKKNRSTDHGETSMRNKITNYRELVLFGKSTGGFECQRQTRSKTENSTKNAQHNEDVYENPIQDYYDSGADDHFDCDQVDIKYEPVSLDHSIDSIENSTHDWTDLPSKESENAKIDRLITNVNTEKYSDSIAQLLKFYQMNKRIPVIKLHRISEEKNESKSDILLKKSENGLLTSSGSKKMVRTVYMDDGSKLFGGVLLKSTNDGQEQCGDCGKTFATEKRLKRHIKQVHLGIKQKDYSIRAKEGKKTLKVIKTPEGKTIYGGITIEPMKHGCFHCAVCHRRCPSMDAIMRHIRWYHLGDEATKIYQERREAYRIKRLKALGKPVPKERIKKAEEMLQNKLYLQSALSKKGKATPNKSENDTKFKKENYTPSTKPPERTLSESEPDVELESDQESNFNDDESNDPNFSPEQNCEFQDEQDSEPEKKSEASSMKKKTYKRGVRVAWQTDGRRVCGGVELIVNEDETEWKCGKKNCSKFYTNKYALTRHIKSAHLGIRQPRKWIRKDSNIKRKGRKATSEKGKEERPHFTAEGLFFSGILSKKVENGWYQCGYERSGNKCGKTFPTSFATLNHIKTDHTNSEVALQRLRCLRMLITPDGKKVYGNVEINELDSNILECNACKKRWTYKTGNKRYLDNICTHIRTNHLGKRACEMYREKRRAMQIRKMKRLGRLVRLKDLKKADEILKHQIPITARVMFDLDPNGEPLVEEPTTKEGKSKNENGKESEDEDIGEYDFSIEEDKDSDSEEEGPTEKRPYSETTKRKMDVRLRATKAGKRFCGEIELIEREGNRQQCGRCKNVYSNVASLTRHIKRLHYGFKEKSLYFEPKIENVHYFKVVEDAEKRKTYAGIDIVDTLDGNIACGICLRSFKVLDHFRRHVRNLHPERLKSYQSSSTETDTKSVANDQIDPKRTFFTKEGLFYNGVLSKKIEKGKYRCGHPREGQPPCQRVCASTFTIVSHIRKEHVTNASSVKPLKKFNRTITTDDGRKIFLGVEMVKLENGIWQCGECQKQFNPKNVSGLMGHIMRMHEQKEGGIYICKYCGKNCGSQCWLELHELKHLDGKNYVCDQCGKSYKQSASLIHHKRQVHKGIKRHTCEICGKQYYHTRDFVTHQLRHKGERPFICSFCGKSFFNIYDMKVHERTHNATEEISQPQQSSSTMGISTPGKDVNKKPVRKSTRKRTSKEEFECNYCDKSYGTSSALKRHVSQQHSGSDSETKDFDNSKVSSDNESYIPNSSPPKKRNSAANSSMPTLENMAPSSTANKTGANQSFGSYSHQISDPPPLLVPVYDLIPPTFPVYGHPPSHYYQ